ncbi:hypothetical protein [Lapillicoccus sp.]|uniref:hypothetical protein n=1 Tax=Lapillicoccus sp. TaxID=1909287 RepID=UPI0025F42871|nr:hypothetical protein [Lapillicoccus sp.]
MTAPLLVYGLPDNLRYSLLRGPILDFLQDNRIPAQWTPRLRGWTVRTERIGDLIALAELAGYVVRMRGPLT